MARHDDEPLPGEDVLVEGRGHTDPSSTLGPLALAKHVIVDQPVPHAHAADRPVDLTEQQPPPGPVLHASDPSRFCPRVNSRLSLSEDRPVCRLHYMPMATTD